MILSKAMEISVMVGAKTLRLAIGLPVTIYL